ncbi:ribbon-helix-helix protein, CopG family [Arthrobacter dokdonensis]|uniref:ribbon-helix-helix protein, CopG family n=1 Tax=Arthrobacter dokdonellae TaxID=2211210 RepID=UPI0014943D46|nr:ribbon-helix-helix protein, CopG family [Arthrobacter dokdonellae]
MANIKVSVNLPEDAVQALRDMAARDGVSMTEALRRSISLQKFVEDQQAEGNAILVKDRNDNVQRLVIR